MYLNSYIKSVIHIDTDTIQSCEGYSPLMEELEQIPPGQVTGVLDELLTDHLIKEPIRYTLLEDLKINECNLNQDVEVSATLQHYFDKLILELGQEAIGCSVNEGGDVAFNKRTFAECIMGIYQLVINRENPDTLLVHNEPKGYWENATYILNRLIIEIAHSVGGDVQDTWNSNLEKSIMDILKRKATLIEPRKFNKGYFPFGNYTLNSSTGEMVKHSARYLSTFGSPVNYNAGADCPVFKKFLGETFNDNDTIQFVQEWFGYTLSTSHKANALLIGIGAGANGKSTLFDVLAQLVGIENVSSAPLSNFNSEFGLEPLLGMKLNLATESDVDAFKTGKLKALTAGESISINRKNKQEVTITLPTKLVFLMNELPLLSDDSFGFERRLLILLFDKTFFPHEQDKDLPKKLNAELEGILTWAIKGLRRLINNNYNFTVSSTMQNAKDKYFGVGNPIEKFVEECVIAEPSNVMEGNELFNAYSIWMANNGFPFKGTDHPQTFWKSFKGAMDLQLIEFKRGKSNGKTVVRDITLK